MNRFASILLLLVCALSWCGAAPPPSVEIARVQTESKKPVAPLYHVLGKQTVQITLRGLPLNEVLADLYVMAEPLGAPVEKDIPVREEIPILAGAVRELFPWSLSLPEVLRPARFLVRFKTREGETWRNIGELHLCVYPSDTETRPGLGGAKNTLPILETQPLETKPSTTSPKAL